MACFTRKRTQLVENLIARNGIQSSRCLIEQQEVSAVAQGANKLKFHSHTARKILDLCFEAQAMCIA